MKVKAYVLVGIVGLLSISAVSKDVRPVEGFSPGDLAPRIEFHSEGYTLLNFWAAYDAESRVRNIKLANEVSKLDAEKISFCSISFDENESIFSETVRIDKLDETTQFQAKQFDREELYGKYKLERGFRNFLINTKGVIVATDVSPEELKNVLDTI